jgi:6-phosphogluconolactonase
VNVKWYSHPDAPAAAKACAEHIGALLNEALANQPLATLAVSGGSTPRLMFEYLAGLELDWKRIHLFWVDERAVPPTDPQSNYRMTEEALIRRAQMPVGNVHRVLAELPPEEAAQRYVEEIRSFFGLGEGRVPELDIIQCGMGADCHTASLFPGSPLITDRTGVAAAVYVDKLKQWRITLLPARLQSSKHSVFLVTGSDKAEAVRNVLKGDYDPMRFPAQIVSHHGSDVTWFLDEAAASRLK